MPNSTKPLIKSIKRAVHLSSVCSEIIHFLNGDSLIAEKWDVFSMVLTHPSLHGVDVTALCPAWEAWLNNASCEQVHQALKDVCTLNKGEDVVSYLTVLFDRGLYRFLEAFYRIKGDLAWRMLVKPNNKTFDWNRYVSRGRRWSYFEFGLLSANTTLAEKAKIISVTYDFFCSRPPHDETVWKSLMGMPVCFSQNDTTSLPLDYWCTLEVDKYPETTRQLHQGGLRSDAIFMALHWNNIATAKLLMTLRDHDTEIASFLCWAMGANIAFPEEDLEIWLYPVLDALDDRELANACLSCWMSTGQKESAKRMRNILLQRYAPRMIASDQVLSTQCGLHVLHAAVITDMPLQEGLLPVINGLKAHGAVESYINTPNSLGLTPLFFAIQKGKFPFVRCLLDYGADPGWVSPHDSSLAPICEAFVSKPNVDSRMIDVICKLLVNKLVDRNDSPERFIDGMVIRAVQLHDMDMLERLSHYFSAGLPNRLKQLTVTKEGKIFTQHALESVSILDAPFKEMLLAWILRYVNIMEPYGDFHGNVLHDLVFTAKDTGLIKMLADKYPEALFRFNCYQATPLFLAMSSQDIDETTFCYLIEQAKQHNADRLQQLLDQRVIHMFSSGDMFTVSILHAGVNAMLHCGDRKQKILVNKQQVEKIKKLISIGAIWYEPYPNDFPSWIKALAHKRIREVYLASANKETLQRVETRQLFYECFSNIGEKNEAYLMILDMCDALCKNQVVVDDAYEQQYLVKIVHQANRRELMNYDAFKAIMSRVLKADEEDFSAPEEQPSAYVGVSGFRFVRDNVNAGLWDAIPGDAIPERQVKLQADMPSMFQPEPVTYNWSLLGVTSHSESVVRVSGSCSTMPWFLYIDEHALLRQGVDSAVIKQFKNVRAKLDCRHIRALTLNTYMRVVMPHGDGTSQSVRIAYEIKLPNSEERIYCFTMQSDKSGQDDASVLIIGFYYGKALHNSAAVHALEQTTRVISLGQSDGQVAQSRP